MLYSTLLIAAAAFSGFVSAQNTTSPIGDCCTVSSGQVPDDLKSDWCRAEKNTCPDICGGQGSIASGGNDCDDDSLKFSCKCKNGTEPDMTEYQQSVPGLMCRFWFDLCINATGDNLSQQFACTSARDSKCGNKTTRSSSASSSGASTSRGPSATSGGGDSASSTGASASQSSGAAAALAMAREYSTPVLAGGMLAVFGLAL